MSKATDDFRQILDESGIAHISGSGVYSDNATWWASDESQDDDPRQLAVEAERKNPDGRFHLSLLDVNPQVAGFIAKLTNGQLNGPQGAGIAEAEAILTQDGQPFQPDEGNPSVKVQLEDVGEEGDLIRDKKITFTFDNLNQGRQGPAGQTGPVGVDSVSVSVDGEYSETPTATTYLDEDTRALTINFSGLRGEKGDTGPSGQGFDEVKALYYPPTEENPDTRVLAAIVDNQETGKKTLQLSFYGMQGPKGEKGDTGDVGSIMEDGAVKIENGGTGATNVEQALANLGAAESNHTHEGDYAHVAHTHSLEEVGYGVGGQRTTLGTAALMDEGDFAASGHTHEGMVTSSGATASIAYDPTEINQRVVVDTGESSHRDLVWDGSGIYGVYNDGSTSVNQWDLRKSTYTFSPSEILSDKLDKTATTVTLYRFGPIRILNMDMSVIGTLDNYTDKVVRLQDSDKPSATIYVNASTHNKDIVCEMAIFDNEVNFRPRTTVSGSPSNPKALFAQMTWMV